MKSKYGNRDAILARLTQAGSPSVAVIAEETGVPKATLYVWLANARRKDSQNPTNQGKLLMTKRTKRRSPSVKFSLIASSQGLSGDGLRAFCDKQGVTVEELLSWRDLALSGLEAVDGDGTAVTRQEHNKQIGKLEKDLRRKNDALAEAAALLILQKKTSEILEAKRWI